MPNFYTQPYRSSLTSTASGKTEKNRNPNNIILISVPVFLTVTEKERIYIISF